MCKWPAWRDGESKSRAGVRGAFHPTPAGFLRLVMDLKVMSVRDPVPTPRPFSRSSLKFLEASVYLSDCLSVCLCLSSYLSGLPLTFEALVLLWRVCE